MGTPRPEGALPTPEPLLPDLAPVVEVVNPSRPLRAHSGPHAPSAASCGEFVAGPVPSPLRHSARRAACRRCERLTGSVSSRRVARLQEPLARAAQASLRARRQFLDTSGSRLLFRLGPFALHTRVGRGSGSCAALVPVRWTQSVPSTFQVSRCSTWGRPRICLSKDCHSSSPIQWG